MNSSILCVVLIALCIGLSEAWWGSRRSSSRSSSSSSSSSSSKPKEKNYFSGFIAGSRDMLKSYNEMKEANTIGADKYFHAKGNYKAAQHGPGGRDAARIISNARETLQSWTGSHADDTAADQEANRWGRNGGDPNKYRPRGLDPKY